ncbi:MAG TPA: ABC transporter substrate-binding protein [Chitinispirillaceae bacterium]|nr:ABC transporter substrate-binding protein [Chitinispirillaceae bacterium]
MKKGMKVKVFLTGALLCGLVSLQSCGGKSKEEATDESGSSFPRSKTLYLAGSQWGDPNSFNPLAESWQAAWPVGDRFNLMYEPLVGYNSLDGKMEPILGSLVSKNNDSIVVDLNPEAKWSDGTPVTSKDVKFIFEIGHRFKNAATAYTTEFISAINVANVDVNGVSVERLSFLVDKKGRNNPLVILDFLQAVRIVPAHIFEKLLAENNNDLSAVQKLKIDVNPVVSGPYNLETYSNEKIVIKRRDDYWGAKALYGGKLPAPQYIIHPIFKSNDHFAIALQKGNLDASQTFIPRIWMKKKDGVSTWKADAPYYVPGSIPLLLINATKAPLNDKNFRRAMAAAINYSNIKELAVSGYSPDIQPGLIMQSGLESKYFNADDAKEFGVSFDLENAKKILADAGYKSVYKADGTLDYMTDKAGNKLPTLSIKSPAGWSDWEAMVSIAVKGMRDAGIDIREGFVDAGLYWPALPSGDFDLIMHKPAASVTPSLPWSRFEAIMSSRNWVPVGGDNKMNENQGRYNQPGVKGHNKAVDSLLKAIPVISDEAQLKDAYRQINKIFMQDQPALPLCHLAEQFYEFSSANWKNWPDENNPYAPPLLPWVGASTKILWQLQPAK